MKRILLVPKIIRSTNRFLTDDKIEPIIMVHGGAGNTLDELLVPKLQGLKDAITLAYKSLISGGAVEAVEQAIRSMDMNENFNSGKGSMLTSDGQVEMDAAIMCGDMRAGAVGCIKNIESPIRVARLLMEQTNCLMLASSGAVEFAKLHGIKEVLAESLVTERARRLLKDKNIYRSTKAGNVGAVALDKSGTLAAGTSSGGTIGRIPGRLGDCCRIGCSIYADNNVAAVSTTGDGDSIIKTSLALTIVENIEDGLSTTEAMQKGLFVMDMRLHNSGGAIAVSKTGELGFYFNSKRMPWAYQTGDTIHFGVEKGEHNAEQVKN